MGQDDISTRLRALASDSTKRTETARLRDVFNDVETTLKAGVSQADVLAELHKSGFTMTMASFKSALQRIRKERKQATQSPSPTLGHDQGKEETPSNPVDIPAGSTMRQRGEAVADKYMASTSPNPLLDRILKEKK